MYNTIKQSHKNMLNFQHHANNIHLFKERCLEPKELLTLSIFLEMQSFEYCISILSTDDKLLSRACPVVLLR